MQKIHNLFLIAVNISAPYFFSAVHTAECLYCQKWIFTCNNVQNQRNIPQLQCSNYTSNQTTASDNFILQCLHHSVQKGFRLHSVCLPVRTTSSHSEAKGIVARSSSSMSNKCPGKKALCSNSLIHVFKIRFFDTGSCFMLQLSCLPERNSASRHNPQQQQQQQSKSELQRKAERKIVTPHLPMHSLS